MSWRNKAWQRSPSHNDSIPVKEKKNDATKLKKTKQKKTLQTFFFQKCVLIKVKFAYNNQTLISIEVWWGND